MQIGGGHVVSIVRNGEDKKPDNRKILSLRYCSNNINKLKNIITGKPNIYSNEAEDIIIDMVKYGDFDFVWLDSPHFSGPLVRRVKRECPQVPVFVFWHTVPYPDTFSGIFRKNGFSYRTLTRYCNNKNTQRSRRLVVEYADACVILNERDATTFRELFRKEPELILPMCLEDKANIAPEESNPEEFSIIFVGGGFHMPNVDGIKWFAKNVMPRLDKRAVLYIVGNAMDNWKDSLEFAGNNNIKIVGRADDLSPYYNKADVAVVPIFYGAGMMTKVAEALMHGKNILASGHALNGYECLDGCRCDTAKEFAERINQLIASGGNKYNPVMRKIYESSYSIDAMTRMLSNFLTSRHII